MFLSLYMCVCLKDSVSVPVEVISLVGFPFFFILSPVLALSSSSTMVDVQTVCCMCGDVGFPDKLFRCNKCRNRFQHSYGFYHHHLFTENFRKKTSYAYIFTYIHTPVFIYIIIMITSLNDFIILFLLTCIVS